MFDTLSSGHLENNLFKQITPYIEPVTYTLGNVQVFVKDGGGKKQLMKNHPAMVSHISIIEQLKNHILFCPDVAYHIVNWSWRWAGGYNQDNDDDDVLKTYSGFEDGTNFQTHPYLSKPQSNPKVIRVPLAGYGDGVEVSPFLKGSDTAARSHLPHCFVPQLCNPLGGSRGVHNIHCMYVSLLSLPPKLRHNHENIFPATFVCESDLDSFGPVRVVAGADPKTGNIIEGGPPTLGSEFRQLAAGVPFEEFGEGYVLQGYLVQWLGDYPARGKMTPFAKSVAAHLFCHHCDIDARKSHSSILHRLFCKDCDCDDDVPCFRSMTEVQHDFADTRKMSQLNAKKLQTKKGYQKNKLSFALDDKYFPGFNVVDGVGNDLMHSEPDGMLKPEAAAMLATLIYKSRYFTLQEVYVLLAQTPLCSLTLTDGV